MQVMIELREVIRQGQGDFVHILNELRWGRVSATSAAKLLECTPQRASKAAGADVIVATKLHPHNINVRAENDKYLLEALNRVAIMHVAAATCPCSSTCRVQIPARSYWRASHIRSG